MKTAFIVSTGRTGTGFFTRLFNDAVDNAWSLHEPWPAFRRRARRLMGASPRLYDRLYFRIPRVHRMRRHAPNHWYVENNYQLFAAVPLIRKAFPDSRIILVIRDGRDVVTSYLNRFRYITTEHITPRNIPHDPAAADWAGWSPVEKLAWYWKTVNRHVLAQKPDLVLRFESVFDDDGKGVYTLLDHFGDLQYSSRAVQRLLDEKVNVNRRAFFPPYPDWPMLWKDQFYRVAGDTMKELGY